MGDENGRPVVYLVSVAGRPNYGDTLVAASWLRYYARNTPDAEIWMDSDRPGQCSVLLDGIHPHAHFTDTLFHACWNSPSDSPTEMPAFGRALVDNPRLIPRETLGMGVLERADLIHILGGGFINSIWPQHAALPAIASAVAARTGARTAITGAGLTPASQALAAALSATLATFDVVDVRDEPSAELLGPSVPHLTATVDDLFVDLRGIRISPKQHPDTVVCVQADLSSQPLSEIADFVVRTLQAWSADQNPVLVLECLPPDDLAVVEHLAPRLPELEIMRFETLWVEGFPVAPGQRWITTRFHPHLLAAAGGAHGVALASGDYYRTKHASLGTLWPILDEIRDPIPLPEVSDPPFGGRIGVIQESKARVAKAVVGLVHAPKAAS